jgi:phosphohistidine phosphatase SixA
MPSSRYLVGALVAAVALTLVAGASAAATPELTRNLRAGGLVVVLRHAATDFSKPDQDPVVVSDCATQRNLSAQGRADARAIGQGVRRLGLPVGKVFSSAYCRTLGTARLAFGRATVHRALLNTIAAEHDDVWRAQIRDARRLFGTKPAAGKLTVLVTHGVVVQETTGQTLEEGEAIVFIDGHPESVMPDTGIYLRPGACLSVDNAGPAPFTLVSSRCPDPGPPTFVEACPAPEAPAVVPAPFVRLMDRAGSDPDHIRAPWHHGILHRCDTAQANDRELYRLTYKVDEPHGHGSNRRSGEPPRHV